MKTFFAAAMFSAFLMGAGVVSTSAQAALSPTEQSNLQSQIDSIISDASLTEDQIASQISTLVQNSSDPEAATNLVLTSTSGSSSSIQQAVGRGLGDAATTIGVTNPSVGDAIDTAVSTNGPSGVKTAYNTSRGLTTAGVIPANQPAPEKPDLNSLPGNVSGDSGDEDGSPS